MGNCWSHCPLDSSLGFGMEGPGEGTWMATGDLCISPPHSFITRGSPCQGQMLLGDTATLVRSQWAMTSQPLPCDITRPQETPCEHSIPTQARSMGEQGWVYSPMVPPTWAWCD